MVRNPKVITRGNIMYFATKCPKKKKKSFFPNCGKSQYFYSIPIVFPLSTSILY